MMMNDRDKQIERLFDDYAEELTPEPRLAARARERMTAERKAKRKFPTGVLAALASAAAVIVVAVAVLPSVIGGERDTVPDSGSAPSAVSATPYEIGDVRAVRVNDEFAREYIDVSAIPTDSGEVFAESYYACYFKNNNELAYVKAIFGVTTANGMLEMSVIAEKSDFNRTDLRTKFAGVMTSSGEYRYRTQYVRGEFVTQAYFSTRDMNYYVSSMGGVEGADGIIRYLANRTGE